MKGKQGKIALLAEAERRRRRMDLIRFYGFPIFAAAAMAVDKKGGEGKKCLQALNQLACYGFCAFR